jgi:hypothetical protein
MSKNRPLHYPAPKKEGFHPSASITVDVRDRRFWFDTFFQHKLFQQQFRRLSLHGVIPVVIGAAATAAGHAQITIRGAAVVVSAGWLSLDIAGWTSETQWKKQYKAIVFCTASCLICFLAMIVMNWFLVSTLEDQRNNVFQNLNATHRIPPGAEDDPMNTMFLVANNSSFDISKKHQIICRTNVAVGNGSHVGANRGVLSESKDGGTKIGFDLAWLLVPAPSKLVAGGDAQTESCLSFFNFQQGTACVDVTLIFWYSLDTQPDLDQFKYFRYVAYKGPKGQFDWYPQPQEDSKSSCERFITRPS